MKCEAGAVGVGFDIGVLMKTALDDLIENPPEDLPNWHASEIETSLMLADEKVVTWELADADYPHTPKVIAGSKKFNQDGGFSKTIMFDGYQVFLAQENSDYSYTSTVGQPGTRYRRDGREDARPVRRHRRRPVQRAEVPRRQAAHHGQGPHLRFQWAGTR